MKKLLFGLLICLSFFACDKTQEELIVGKWEIERYRRNGNDETNRMLIRDYVETYTEGGGYSRTYLSGDSVPVRDCDGQWRLNEQSTEIAISGVIGLKKFSAESPTLSSNHYFLERVQENLLWYTFINSNDSHMFQMTRVKEE